jgi:MOSC domain-containing protein YiiM
MAMKSTEPTTTTTKINVSKVDLKSELPKTKTSMIPIAKIASLHLHPKAGSRESKNRPMIQVDKLDLVLDKGAAGAPARHFKSLSAKDGSASKRQISLIDRSLLRAICEYEPSLGKQWCAPGKVRSNIETERLSTCPESPLGYQDWVGKFLICADAVLEIAIQRDPCYQMDMLAQGLQKAMKGGWQGVLCRVVRSGTIVPEDTVYLCDSSSSSFSSSSSSSSSSSMSVKK